MAGLQRHIEDAHQQALFQWAKLVRPPPAPDVPPHDTLADMMYAIPNGGQRNGKEAARMQGLGVKAGVSDIHLPLARGTFLSFYGEMKKPVADFRSRGEARAALTQKQRLWALRMALAGHFVVIAYGWEFMRDALKYYIELPRNYERTGFGRVCTYPDDLFDPDQFQFEMPMERGG